jgi:hypothetical protein
MPPIRLRTLLALAALAALALSASAQAQYSGYTMSIPSMNSFIATQQLSAQVRLSQRVLDEVTAAGEGRTPDRSAPAEADVESFAVEQEPTATTFQPSRQRMMVSRFAASLSDDPAHVKEMNATFAAGLQAFEAEAQRMGRPNSVAMAFAYLVGVCVMVDSDQEPAEEAILTLQAKVDAAFGQSAEFQALSDAQRQQLYETFVLMATLPLAGYMVAKETNDDALLQTYREVAATALETTLGVRPSELRFTANSLETR